MAIWATLSPRYSVSSAALLAGEALAHLVDDGDLLGSRVVHRTSSPLSNTRRDEALVQQRTLLRGSHTSSFAQPQAGIFTWPFAGWLHGGTPVGQLLWVLVLPVTLVAALVRGRRQPRSYSLYVGGCLVLLLCSAPAITGGWYDSTRVVAAAFPLAVWMLVAPPPTSDEAGGLEAQVAAAPSHLA